MTLAKIIIGLFYSQNEVFMFYFYNFITLNYIITNSLLFDFLTAIAIYTGLIVNFYFFCDSIDLITI